MTKRTALPATPNFAELEEQVLAFWDQDHTFEKSVQQRPTDKAYVFYDGPPFATGLPHYGHLLASTIKDVIPRYWTMKGYRVERVWGWDCHGLPIENMIEGELQLKGGKKGIEDFGIDKFNQACRSAILRFDKEWEVVIRRLGRWVDFQHSYKTMDKNYMESVWWGFSQLFRRNMVYEGRKVVLYCPRCATPLSNFEIAMDNSYKDVVDNSVYVKFRVRDEQSAEGNKPTFFLAWTTTPWTLPGNVAIAVQPEAEYALVAVGEEQLWMAKDKVAELTAKQEIQHPTIIKTVLGKALVGTAYEPLYDFMPLEGKRAHYVAAASFVSLTDGTGIVHTAAIFGEDDYALAQALDLPCVPTLDDEGKFLPFVTPLAGTFYKKAEDWIVNDLTARGLLFAATKYTHSYPFCYRCGTPLYYNAVPAWFIDIQSMKKALEGANEQINWYPEYLKHGRFGKGLETAPDWNISRSRYWGTPMPIWQHGAHRRVIGSLEELATWAVDPSQIGELTDLHREFLDDLEVWVDDAKTIKGKRIPEVFDCWVESGSMPFAAVHYPFENKAWFDHNYPAQFISEYIAQTRAWFYCMHVLSVGLFNQPAYQNALTTGTILAEDGTKMSKSKKNYPDPMLVVQKYGVDSLRLYLMNSVVMKGDNLNFNEREVGELRKNVFVIWWNVLSFYLQFATHDHDVRQVPSHVTHIMDRWMLSRLQSLTATVTDSMDAYDVVRASRSLIEFVNELSTWFLRQSRERLKSNDRADVSAVLGHALYTLAQLCAPLTPFFSETIHHYLVEETSSIHLSSWPTIAPALQDTQLEEEMKLVRRIVESGHAERRDQGIKVRQPLAGMRLVAPKLSNELTLREIITTELNVKTITWESATDTVDPVVVLDTTLTPELIAEGQAREVMRHIQQLRKDAGVAVDALVEIVLPEWPEAWTEQIKAKTKVATLSRGTTWQLHPATEK